MKVRGEVNHWGKGNSKESAACVYFRRFFFNTFAQIGPRRPDSG
jgi:hypothetical protein